jgi:hypothetical protein
VIMWPIRFVRCAACPDDKGVVYDDGPEAWLFLCHDCVADVVRVAGAAQETDQ